MRRQSLILALTALLSLSTIVLSRPVPVSAATPLFETSTLQIARVCGSGFYRYTCTTDQSYSQGATGVSASSGQTSLSVDGGRIAEARSYADLSTGKLGVYSKAQGPTLVDFLGRTRSDTEAIASAEFKDRVTLQVSPTITGSFTTRLHAVIDGSVTGLGTEPDLGFPYPVVANFEVRLAYHDDDGAHCETWCKHDFPASHIVKSLHDGSFTLDMDMPIYLNDSISSRIAPTFDMTIAMNAGGQGLHPIDTNVGTGIQNAIYDFSNTAALTLQLPAGVSFTSNSGTFLSAIAPPSDTTPPTTSVSLEPSANGNGWNNSSVTATLTAVDNAGGSGVAATDYAVDGSTCGAPMGSTVGCSTYDAGNKPVIGTEGKHTLYFFSVDAAGNAEAQQQQAIWIDKTAPTITFSGNVGTYQVDQPISITCSTVDPLSNGVASGVDSLRTNCAGIAAPAYSYPLGTSAIAAAAYDNAGNATSATSSFTVAVSYGSLCNLTVNFVESSAKFQSLPSRLQAAIQKLATAACNYLATANVALTPKQKASAIAAYQQLVAGLVRPGWLTQDQANLLTSLSNGL